MIGEEVMRQLHDVDQVALKNKLDEVVMSCVNGVGVELNTASKQLLCPSSNAFSTSSGVNGGIFIFTKSTALSMRSPVN